MSASAQAVAELVFDGASGPRELWPYGRGVWSEVRERALAWRRRPDGPALVRANGGAEALWWATVEGVFEGSGGVLDLLYRASVLSAFVADHTGDIHARGREGDLWLRVLESVCRDRGRRLHLETSRAQAASSPPRLRSRARSLARHWAGALRPVPPRSEVMLVLTHGRMALRDASGAMVDRYTEAYAAALRRRFRTCIVSLEPPATLATDLRAALTGAYVPWIRSVSIGELRAYGAERERWSRVFAGSPALSLTSSEFDLSALLRERAVGLVGRGIALAQLYDLAFGRIAAASGVRVAVATEAHSNVGRMIGHAAPEVRLLAPQAGIIGPGGETNSAYDHRGLPPLSVDRSAGCPVPARSLVWGLHDVETLVGLGHAPREIAVVGLPREIPRAKAGGRGVLYLAGANEDIFAFAYGFGEEIATIRRLRELLPVDIVLTVRLHPTHDPLRYRASLPTAIRLSAAAERPLMDDLASNSWATGKASTALVEAAMAGLPVLAINLGPTPDIWGLVRADIPYVEDDTELPAALAALLTAGPIDLSRLVARSGRDSVQCVLDEIGTALA